MPRRPGVPTASPAPTCRLTLCRPALPCPALAAEAACHGIKAACEALAKRLAPCVAKLGPGDGWAELMKAVAAANGMDFGAASACAPHCDAWHGRRMPGLQLARCLWAGQEAGLLGRTKRPVPLLAPPHSTHPTPPPPCKEPSHPILRWFKAKPCVQPGTRPASLS